VIYALQRLTGFSDNISDNVRVIQAAAQALGGGTSEIAGSLIAQCWIHAARAVGGREKNVV
jgi:hypothetical protein